MIVITYTDTDIATCAHIEISFLPACARMGTCMVVSAFSSISVEDIAQATDGGLRWFQLHAVRDMEVNKELILRAEKAGCKAIAITVDTPATGNRTRPIARAKLPKGDLAHFPPDYFQAAADLTAELSDQARRIQGINGRLANITWETIDWFRSITKLPILLKGILTAEDALEALKHDIQGIIVSNHGGRQLDGVPATVSVVVSSPVCPYFCAKIVQKWNTECFPIAVPGLSYTSTPTRSTKS